MFFMKKLMDWTKEKETMSRNMYIDKTAIKRILAATLVSALLCGCSATSDNKEVSSETGGRNESASDSHVDFQKLREENSDIFAWLYVPDTGIDYPICQSSEGDDSYYMSHDSYGEESPDGAVYIESANMSNMCDFNEVVHGANTGDGRLFSDVEKFLDRAYFEDHEYIYVYTEGNALIYYVFAAYTRENTRLLAQYDFSYASGCNEFLDEIYSNRSMNKIIRSGWENALDAENFIITLTTNSSLDPSEQVVVVGCLVGDVQGVIDRYVDYSEPDE